MYARVSRYEVPIEKLDNDIRGADETVRKVAAIPGSQGLFYLVDRETGRTMSITLWASEQAMLESEALASWIREETSTASAAKVVSVERYEVVAQPTAFPAGRKAS